MSWNRKDFHSTGPLSGESIGNQWIPITKHQVMWCFDIFIVVGLNKLLNQQLAWHSCDITVIKQQQFSSVTTQQRVDYFGNPFTPTKKLSDGYF